MKHGNVKKSILVLGLLAVLSACTETWEEGAPPYSEYKNKQESKKDKELTFLDGDYLKYSAPILSSLVSEYGTSLEIYRSAKTGVNYYMPDRLEWARNSEGKIKSGVFVSPKPVRKNQFGINEEDQKYHGVLGYELVLQSSESQKKSLAKIPSHERTIALQESDVFQSAYLLWEREMPPEKDERPSVFEDRLMPFKLDFSRTRLGSVISGTLLLTERAAINFKILHEMAEGSRRERINSPIATVRYCVSFSGLSDVFTEDSHLEEIKYRNRKLIESTACTNKISVDELIAKNVEIVE